MYNPQAVLSHTFCSRERLTLFAQA